MISRRPELAESLDATGAVGPGGAVGITPAVRKRRFSISPEMAVMVALGLVSLLNYAYTAVLVWLLPPGHYAVVGAASSLLLVCGTVASASIPWVLAREVARCRQDDELRKSAVSFCIAGTAVEAMLAGLVTGGIAIAYGDGLVVAAVLGSVVTIFTSATAIGYLQGFERFNLIAVLKLAEVVVKFGVGVFLVESGFGAAGAIVAFGIGSAAVTVVGVVAMRDDLYLKLSSIFDRRLWKSAIGLMSIQAGVALLASIDVIVGSLTISHRSRLATYEVAQILTRIPIFVATALSIIVFPRLVTGSRSAQAGPIAENLSLWMRLCIPVAIVTGTLPPQVLTRLFPSAYGNIGALLAWTAAAGLAMGAVNLTSTYFQAADVYRRPFWVLSVAVPFLVAAAVLGIRLAGVRGLGAAAAAIGTLVAVTFVVMCRRHWPESLDGLWKPALVAAVESAPLIVLRSNIALWSVWAVVGVGAPIFFSLARSGRSEAPKPL